MINNKELKSIVKYPGSKWRIAKWIISNFQPHHSYLEPYFGSGAVFFRKEAANIETVNDLDGNIVNLFRIIREDPESLATLISKTPYSRQEYESTFSPQADQNNYEKARVFLIKCWQGFGFRSIGHKVGWKNDIQGRERMYAVKEWYMLPGEIINTADRLKQVQIENRPALEVIKRFRYPNVLIYVDPPYILSTRSQKNYLHEMTDNDHIELLETLLQHPGQVVLSGYENETYNTMLKDWKKVEISALAEFGKKRTEVLWIKDGDEH